MNRNAICVPFSTLEKKSTHLANSNSCLSLVHWLEPLLDSRGNISLFWKYYEQNADRYALSNNGTHNSVQMTFYHTATVEHFEIDGTEGAR